jgi:hypothetical protein
MSDQLNKPTTTDAGTNGAAAPAGGTDVGKGTDRQDGDSAVLTFLKEATGREFSSKEEALKSVKNLNSMVGDQSIADLRKKADLGSKFEKLVSGYAKTQGLEPDEARADLMALIEGDGGGEADARVAEAMSSVSKIEQRLDLADLLAANPEAKHVIDDVKDLAKARGISFQEAYGGSKALQSAAKQLAASMTKDGGQPSSSNPSGRLAANTQGKDYQSALEAFEKNRTGGNAEALVAAALFGK